MRHSVYLIAFLLLWVQQGCMGVPVDTDKGVQYVYSYLGYIDTRSSACDERIARWSVTGNLTAQSFDNYWIFQLDNLKTSIFNGPKADLNLSHDEDVPKEAEVLKLPFIFDIDLDISVNADDPLWSINLKRGIVSNFHKLVAGKSSEKSVFGECETVYVFKDKTNVVKTINHESCKDKPDTHDSNVRSGPAPEDFEPIHRETVVQIKPDVDNEHVLRSIHSVSRLSYKPMHKSPNSQHIDQHVQLDLLDQSSEFDRINTDKLTTKRNLIFQYEEDEWSNGRHVYDDAKGLTEEFFTYYDNFEKYLEATPIENRKNATDEPMQHMFYSMAEMPDVNDLRNLHEKVENKRNWEMYSTFMSLLSYIGTNNSIKYINELLLKGEFENSPNVGIRLLATFPQYIDKPTNELVHSLEGLLNVENVKLHVIKSSQILSFASVVARAFKKKTISDENLNKYTKLYHDKYLGSELYEEKMMYLLGLVNMAQGLTTDFIIKIITDKSQSANLRSLALAGFKRRLWQSNPIKIFNTLWPVVQDKKENFDVRVQILDYMLGSGIPEEQFDIILQEYKKYQADDIHGKHLANYFLTSIESNKNSTEISMLNSDLATAALKNEHFPIFSRPWTTGNYRLTYLDSDPNIGSYVQAQLIANPALNTISTAQFTTRNFASSFDTDEYSIYLKLHGVTEIIYKENFFKHISEDTTVPELLKLIKEFDFKMKKYDRQERNFHIEVVVFMDGRAVYAANINAVNKFSVVLDEMIENTFMISFPIRDSINIPSVLGTPLGISNDMQQITNFGYLRNKDLKYRSSWNFQTSLKAYNPLVDTTIASYKYYGDEIGLRTKTFLNLRNFTAGWTVKQDSLNRVWDNLIGTSVEHEPILKRYCSECDAMHEIPTNLNTHSRMKDFSNLGMKLNYTIETHYEEFYKETTSEKFNEFISTHYSDAEVLPYAKPLLAVLHFMKHNAYFKEELQRGSYRSAPVDENGIQTLVKMDWAGKNTIDPFEDTHDNYSIKVINKKLYEEDDETNINECMVLLELKSTHNHKDEHGKDKVKMIQNLYIHEYETNDTGFNLCASRVELLPAVRSDKFSLLPTEETTATIVIQQDHTPANHTEMTCSDNSTITLTESYIVTEEINKKMKESEDYKECQKESEGLSFVPPTRACLASFIASSQYNKHTVHAEIKNVIDMDGTGLDKNHFFESSRVDHNKMKFEVLATPFGIELDGDKVYKYTTYFPYQTKNSAADVYRDNDIISGFKRSCIVTAKRIRSFTGHNFPIDGSKQVAFVECFENAMRGMTIEKISDTHVGFRLWSRNNTIDATVHGDKIKIALNGDDLHESYLPKDEEISVRFLDKNVVLIADDKLTVYYNTEYIYIKASPIYNDLICGVCSQI